MVHMGTTRTMLTFEEFESLPDRPGKQELLRGELIDLPPAELRHNRIAHLIYELLKAALNQAHTRGEALDLGEVFHEMGYQLAGHSWVQPDVSVTHAGQGEGKYFAGAPAIAVEVVSPSNSAEDMDTKAELYFQFGAREVWRVYPKTRHVVVHVRSKAEVVTQHDSLSTPMIPGFAMSIDAVLA
jgi:Uma2 family endonuclease